MIEKRKKEEEGGGGGKRRNQKEKKRKRKKKIGKKRIFGRNDFRSAQCLGNSSFSFRFLILSFGFSYRTEMTSSFAGGREDKGEKNELG